MTVGEVRDNFSVTVRDKGEGGGQNQLKFA